MRVGVIGASGFIGKVILKQLQQHQLTAIPFSRTPRKEWRLWSDTPDLSHLDAIINLAGLPVDKPWTPEYKQALITSRVDQTRTLVNAIANLPADQRPRTLINTSAVGIYGSRDNEVLTENSSHRETFLGKLCIDWEAEALKAQELGLRVATPRVGLVLGRGGSAFERMLRVFRLGLGGNLGNGQQWMPWIHIEDMAGIYLHALLNDQVSGAINGVAAETCTNQDFTKALGNAVNRPTAFPAPKFALKIAFDEFADVILASQRIQPEVALNTGYQFQYPTIQKALHHLCLSKG